MLESFIQHAGMGSILFVLCALGCADPEEVAHELPVEETQEEEVEPHPSLHERIWTDSLGSDLVAVTLVDGESLHARLVSGNELARLDTVDRATRFFYHLQVESAAQLEQLLERLGTEPERLRNISVAALPADLSSLPIPRKKEIFFQALLPLVVFHNTTIAAHRQRLEALQQAPGLLPDELERRFLLEMSQYYSLDPALPSLADTLRVLLQRVDRIPPALVLAQAAIESGWGSSRFCQQGNNLFGQRVWNEKITGLAPQGRAQARFRLAVFPTIGSSIGSYMRNLNTHPAYEEFRQLRQRLRRQGDQGDPLVLAGTLTKYSVRGQDYVDDILLLIRQNRLTRFEAARLQERLQAL